MPNIINNTIITTIAFAFGKASGGVPIEDVILSAATWTAVFFLTSVLLYSIFK